MPIASPSNRRLRRQNKQSAAKYISNVEIGIFPSTKDVEQIPRWTKTQQSKLDQAKNDGTWQSNGWFSKEFDFMDKVTQQNFSVREGPNGAVLFARHTLSYAKGMPVRMLLRGAKQFAASFEAAINMDANQPTAGEKNHLSG